MNSGSSAMQFDKTQGWPSESDAVQIGLGTHADPFAILGLHVIETGDSRAPANDVAGDSSGTTRYCLRAFFPGVKSVHAIDPATETLLCSLIESDTVDGFFVGVLPEVFAAGKGLDDTVSPYVYKLSSLSDTQEPTTWIREDPYRFTPVLGDMDEHLISEGSHLQLWKTLGAHVIEHQGIAGVHFALWAPNASRVSVVGNFNFWDGRCHCMRRRGQTGVWEVFIPGLSDGEPYKYELLDNHGNLLPQKADPVGFGSEHPPQTASIVRALDHYHWSDQNWLKKRQDDQNVSKPMLVYEVHLGSWQRVVGEDLRMLSYAELAEQLVEYVKALGFTHIELMPISEFPFDGSWGYQPVGLFAPTIRHGTLQEFRAFVDACHQADIGVILDWVPGHFPEDAHGLGQFDGTALYEHADRREGFHPDWNTLVFNYGRAEVANYLLANALYWFEEFHIDAVRVDAVASMLYRDYSRKEGEWIPNEHGGRENLEAIRFLQRVNESCYREHPGIVTIAEESTAFPGVTGMTSSGGLGFGFKWNMGWMNDTLAYMQQDPVHRKYHHDKLTFGLHYAFSENFVLPLSHDEVVHGKGSLISRMPGNEQERFANLRAYYAFMWGHPGKKLLFMGGEFAQLEEWNYQQSLDWHLLDVPLHRGVQTLITDLNMLLRNTPALYECDNTSDGFRWVDEYAADESIFAWLRFGLAETPPMLVVCNFTPVPRSARRVGIPAPGLWVEKLNTDSIHYGGSGQGNLGGVQSDDIACSGQPFSLELTLPPLTVLFFELAT
ncbi:MAG: 1,4-alpha-glucan branching protein GlgB [Granulosicoccus sp.]|nr:1,4-alpha-glucan branching protein GlgB [Granulosicoccus sp.]